MGRNKILAQMTYTTFCLVRTDWLFSGRKLEKRCEPEVPKVSVSFACLKENEGGKL